MHRTQIYLETTQWKIIKEIARVRGSTLSEIIREAIAMLIPKVKAATTSDLQNIVSLYRDESDRRGSVEHDDIYE